MNFCEIMRTLFRMALLLAANLRGFSAVFFEIQRFNFLLDIRTSLQWVECVQLGTTCARFPEGFTRRWYILMQTKTPKKIHTNRSDTTDRHSVDSVARHRRRKKWSVSPRYESRASQSVGRKHFAHISNDVVLVCDQRETRT